MSPFILVFLATIYFIFLPVYILKITLFFFIIINFFHLQKFIENYSYVFQCKILKIRRSRIISINLIFYRMIGKSQLLKWQNIKVKENVILYNFLIVLHWKTFVSIKEIFHSEVITFKMTLTRSKRIAEEPIFNFECS